MRVTIIPADRVIYVNGNARRADDHVLFPEVHAVQWYDNHGEIEHIDRGKPNERIDSIAPYMHLIDHHAVVANRENDLFIENEEKLKQAKVESSKSLYPMVEDIIRRVEILEKKLAG